MSKKQVHDFQEELVHNEDERNHFVNAEFEGDSDDSDKIQISLPKKSDKKTNIEEIMITQLVKQQNLFLSAQKKLSKLQTEIDTEEVKKRYLTLDLNNEQVAHSETKETLSLYRKGFRDVGTQLFFVQLYLLFYSLYTLFMNYDLVFGVAGLSLMATSIHRTFTIIMRTETFGKKKKT